MGINLRVRVNKYLKEKLFFYGDFMNEGADNLRLSTVVLCMRKITSSPPIPIRQLI